MGALLLSVLLAGCVENGGDPAGDEQEEVLEPGPHIEGIGPDFVVLMNPLHQEGCNNVEVVVEIPEDRASSLVPEPFRPAAVGQLGEAALSLEVHSCASSTSEEADRSYARAWVSVFVEPPVLPEPASMFQVENRTREGDADSASHVYVLAAYPDGRGFERFLRQSGIPFEQAWVDLELDEALDVVIVQAGVESREDGDEALRLVASGLRVSEEIHHRTSWAVSRHGVQAFEELRTPEGTMQRHTGSGICLVNQGLFEPALGLQGCMPNQVQVTQGFQVTGYSLWFHDVRVLG